MNKNLECLEAIYNDTLWNATKLKHNDGSYDEALRLHMRKESQNRCFFCPECGENLILNAGNIREPYFRHYDGSECVMADMKEYTHSFYVREQLYSLAKRSFPKATITKYAKVKKTAYRTQILIEDIHLKMALNYVSDSTKLERIEKMQEAFLENGIIPVWFCRYRKSHFEKMTTVQYQVSLFNNILKFIDFHEDKLYLKKYVYDKGKENVLYKEYRLSEQWLGFSGEFKNNFANPENEVYEKEVKTAFIIRQKDIDYGQKIYAFLEEQGMLEPVSKGENIYTLFIKMKHKPENEALGAVYMESKEEDWLLPKFTGLKEERETARAMRRALLAYADEQTKAWEKETEDKLASLIKLLSSMTIAGDWVLMAEYIS